MLRPVPHMSPRALRLAGEHPLFVENELRWPRDYPRTFVVAAPGGLLRAVWRLSGWRAVAEAPDVARKRTLFCWILHNEDRVGALRFQQIDLGWTSNSEVFLTLDAESHELMNLAWVLTECWDDVCTQVGDYGPITDFQGLWMRHEYARGALWLPFAQRFLASTLRQRSILILKVFPLEFEGKLPAGSPNAPLFERRRRAMVQYYRKLLGVELMPGERGGAGWMWAPRPGLRSIVAMPARRSPR